MATEWAIRRAKGLEERERRKRLEDDGLEPEPIRFFPGRDEGEIVLTSEVVELAGELPLGGTGPPATRYQTGYLRLKPLNNSRYSMSTLSDGTIRLTQEPAGAGDPQSLGRPLRPTMGIASLEPAPTTVQASSVGVEAPKAWAIRRAKGLEERERRKRRRPGKSQIEPEPIRLIPGRAAGAILLTNEVASLAGDLPLDGVSTRYTTGYLQLTAIDNSRYRIALNEEI